MSSSSLKSHLLPSSSSSSSSPSSSPPSRLSSPLHSHSHSHPNYSSLTDTEDDNDNDMPILPPPSLTHQSSSTSSTSPHHNMAPSPLPPSDLLHHEPTPYLVSNVDTFLIRLYSYYTYGGYWGFYSSQISYAIQISFSCILCVFLILFVEWNVVFTCDTLQECSGIINVDIPSPPTFASIMTFLFISLSSLYLLWFIIHLLSSISDQMEIRKFYEDKLHIPDDLLPFIEWDDIVKKIISFNDQTPILRVKRMTELDITQRILRKENFIIAMIDEDIMGMGKLNQIIDQQLYTLLRIGKGNQENNNNNSSNNNNNNSSINRISDNDRLLHGSRWSWIFYGFYFDFCLRFSLLFNLFNEEFSITYHHNRPAAIQKLRFRFKCLGIINFLLFPFIVLILTVFFLFKYSFELNNRRTSTLTSMLQFTPLSLWRIRSLNELSHHFHRRISHVTQSAQSYLGEFPNRVKSEIFSTLSFCCGGLLIILVIFTMGDSEILNVRVVGDRTILSWMAILSAMLAISRGMISSSSYVSDSGVSSGNGENDEYNEYKVFAPTEKAKIFTLKSFYSPLHWEGKYSTNEVKQEFQYMFTNKILLFVNEILSILALPIIFTFYLPAQSERIVDFIINSTVTIKGMGDLCRQSTFSTMKINYDYTNSDNNNNNVGTSLNPNLSSPSSPSSSSLPPRPPSSALSRYAKVSTSLINFSSHHPSWDSETEAKQFKDNNNTHYNDKDKEREYNNNNKYHSSSSSSSPYSSDPSSSFGDPLSLKSITLDAIMSAAEEGVGGGDILSYSQFYGSGNGKENQHANVNGYSNVNANTRGEKGKGRTSDQGQGHGQGQGQGYDSEGDGEGESESLAMAMGMDPMEESNADILLQSFNDIMRMEYRGGGGGAAVGDGAGRINVHSPYSPSSFHSPSPSPPPPPSSSSSSLQRSLLLSSILPPPQRRAQTDFSSSSSSSSQIFSPLSGRSLILHPPSASSHSPSTLVASRMDLRDRLVSSVQHSVLSRALSSSHHGGNGIGNINQSTLLPSSRYKRGLVSNPSGVNISSPAMSRSNSQNNSSSSNTNTSTTYNISSAGSHHPPPMSHSMMMNKSSHPHMNPPSVQRENEMKSMGMGTEMSKRKESQ